MNAKTIRYMQACYNAYIKHPNRSLYECYRKPSLLKENAYQNCAVDELMTGGKNGSVISYNSQIFVYAYTTDTDFIVITPNKKLVISLKEVSRNGEE